MSENPSIISALKRLERAGSEESRTTEKLREAASLLGGHVAAMCPGDATGILAGGYDLPRGYTIYNHGGKPNLAGVFGPELEVPVGADRDSALAFAQDIASGWLIELVDWLEARTTESADAVAVLERAAEAMR